MRSAGRRGALWTAFSQRCHTSQVLSQPHFASAITLLVLVSSTTARRRGWRHTVPEGGGRNRPPSGGAPWAAMPSPLPSLGAGASWPTWGGTMWGRARRGDAGLGRAGPGKGRTMWGVDETAPALSAGTSPRCRAGSARTGGTARWRAGCGATGRAPPMTRAVAGRSGASPPALGAGGPVDTGPALAPRADRGPHHDPGTPTWA